MQAYIYFHLQQLYESQWKFHAVQVEETIGVDESFDEVSHINQAF